MTDDRKKRIDTQPYPPLPPRQAPNRGQPPHQFSPTNQTLQGIGPATPPVHPKSAKAPRQVHQPRQEQKEDAEERRRHLMEFLGKLTAVWVGTLVGFVAMHFWLPYAANKWGHKSSVVTSTKPSDAPSGSTMPRGLGNPAGTAPPRAIAASASAPSPIPTSVASEAPAGQPATPPKAAVPAIPAIP